MNWQPIETAPKNEDVLVFTGERIYSALFVDDATDPFHEPGRGSSDFDGLWTVDDNKLGPYALRGARPTHWMPLPAAPGEAAAVEKVTLPAEEWRVLEYWLNRCEAKGHLDNCSDLVEPWAALQAAIFSMAAEESP